MNKLIALIVCAVASIFATASQAATQFTQSTDCYSAITVSGGGLTLSDGGVGNFNSAICKANRAKYSGHLYFEFTYGGTIGGNAYVGITQPTTVFGSPDPTMLLSEFNPLSQQPSAVLGYTFSGDIQWENSALSGTQTQVAGHTGALAFDFDTDPIQVWFTADVGNLICDTSGGTGTNAPMWNNSCGTSGHPIDPLHSGTTLAGGFGGKVVPNDGTGHTGAAPGASSNFGPFIPGYQWVPVFQGANPGSTPFTQVTFNFGGSAFAGTLPSGYSTWDSATGDNPPHGPATINVANAPTYANSATMTQGVAATHTLASRLDGGPGCNKSGFTNGSDCFLWQALNGGTTSSSGDPSATWACATPANTGGIYATSFPGATTVTDNGVTFACLAKLDYTTLTGAFNDGEGDWAAGTNYYYGAVVRHGGFVYINQMPMSASPWVCTSGSTFAVPSDGGCTTWVLLATLQYTSKANQLPHQQSFDTSTGGWAGYGHKEIMFNWPVTFELYDGGHDRDVYQPGVNGEDLPILEMDHSDWTTADAGPNCYQSAGVDNFNFVNSCDPHGPTVQLPMAKVLFTVPLGDSFVDNIAPGTDPITSSDPTRGMTAFSNKVYGASPSPGGGNPFGSAGEPIGWSDGLMFYSRMQLWSANGSAMAGHLFPSSGGPGSQRLDNAIFDQMIFESDGTTQLSSFSCDGGCNITNSLLIDRSTVGNNSGIDLAYETGNLSGNTIIGPGGVTNNTAISINSTLGPNGPIFNNVIIGYVNCFAFQFGQTYTTSGNNAIDLASCPTTSYTTSLGNPATAGTLVGLSLTGITPSSEMIQPSLSSALDIRLKNTGALYGGGASVTPNITGAGDHDIIGVVRPQSGRFDIGASEFSGGAPPPSPSGPGRLFLRGGKDFLSFWLAGND